MAKGNDPQRWESLLKLLDEKLQLGLLDHLKKVNSYHFEDDTLFLEPASKEEAQYLARESVVQQLKLLAQDVVRITEVKVTKLQTGA